MRMLLRIWAQLPASVLIVLTSQVMQVTAGMHNIRAFKAEKQQNTNIRQGGSLTALARTDKLCYQFFKKRKKKGGWVSEERAAGNQGGWGVHTLTKGFLLLRCNTVRFSLRECLQKERREGGREKANGFRMEPRRGVNCCKLWLLAFLQREQYFNGCATCRAWGRLADPRLCHPSHP